MQSVSDAMMSTDLPRPGIYQSTRSLLKKLKRRKKIVTEELDSLRVMAPESIEFVLAPKYLAALIAVPCLSIVPNVCGILAGSALRVQFHSLQINNEQTRFSALHF